MQHRCPRRLNKQDKRHWTTAAILLGCVLVAGAVALGYDRWKDFLRDSFEPGTMLILAQGIDNPPCHSVERVLLPDDAEVIGVTMAGKHRAYLIQAFLFPHHVVNDLLGKVPVSVTYCDRTDTAQVFTAKKRRTLLHIDLGGWLRYAQGSSHQSGGSGSKNGRFKGKGCMLLYVDGKRYLQEGCAPLDISPTDSPFPYSKIPCQRTTWKNWKVTHPDTDIYTGPEPLAKAAISTPHG